MPMLSRIALAVLILLNPCEISAATYQVGVASSLMQQPTSQFYHLLYGVYGDISTSTGSVIFRAQYLERPKFNAAGYVDQESAHFYKIGTRLDVNSHVLTTFLGLGTLEGYIKPDQASHSHPMEPKRTYRVQGLSMSAFYNLQWRSIATAVGLQSFVGYSNEEQLRAFVGWPYNFFTWQVGYQW